MDFEGKDKVISGRMQKRRFLIVGCLEVLVAIGTWVVDVGRVLLLALRHVGCWVGQDCEGQSFADADDVGHCGCNVGLQQRALGDLSDPMAHQGAAAVAVLLLRTVCKHVSGD